MSDIICTFFDDLDGPNIAYHGNPEPHYSQLKLVVEKLKSSEYIVNMVS